MTKIKTIQIVNLKAISELSIDLNGYSAIITGGNNKGKSTLLKSIPDRIRGERPELIVRDKEYEGKGDMVLTSGERFIWEFNTDGKDRLSFITKDGFKAAVTKEISKRFFPVAFDIDDFLSAQPKEQSKILQKLVGIDFTEIDYRYKSAYDARTIANKAHQTELVRLQAINPIPDKVEKIDAEKLVLEKQGIRKKLNEIFESNQSINKQLRQEWDAEKDKKKAEVENFNKAQDEKQKVIDRGLKINSELKEMGYQGNEVYEWLEMLPKALNKVEYVGPEEPKYMHEIPDDKELKEIDEKINNASKINDMANQYEIYIKQVRLVKEGKHEAENKDAIVKGIEAEKKELLQNGKLPQGFEITDNGILVDGFPLDKNQISSSKLYCAALRLGAISLGEVKTLHFDASTLDKNTLTEIENWAIANDLQLLIERPDYEGGEIEYKILEN